MTLTIETAIEILVFLGGLIGIYLKLNNKTISQEGKILAIIEKFDTANKVLDDKIKDTNVSIDELYNKMEINQKEITTALYHNALSIERLSSAIENMQKNFENKK